MGRSAAQRSLRAARRSPFGGAGRRDLAQTLGALFADRARGAVPSFARIVIETSGLADPGPVLQTFAGDRALGEHFHVQALVTAARGKGIRRLVGDVLADNQPMLHFLRRAGFPLTLEHHGAEVHFCWTIAAGQ